MSEIEVLEELGLTEAESKVYTALLELGSSLAGPIIKKTNLHRGTTYQILQRLGEKGLVSSIIKEKKQHFEAADPERLLDVLKEKEERLKEIIPKLKIKKELSLEKQEITVYSGIKGLRSVFDKIIDELSPDGTYYDFGVSGMFKEVMGPYWELWQKKKKIGRVKSKVIFNEDIKKRHPELLKNYYGEYKFHPEEYSSTTDTMIYNDTLILLIWTAKPPIAIVIKNKENAQSYKNQFNIFWKNMKK